MFELIQRFFCRSFTHGGIGTGLDGHTAAEMSTFFAPCAKKGAKLSLNMKAIRTSEMFREDGLVLCALGAGTWGELTHTFKFDKYRLLRNGKYMLQICNKQAVI